LVLRVLRALASQRVEPDTFEVLVICDGDVDGSAGACRRLAPAMPYLLRVLTQDNQGPAAARNCGVAAARAPLIVFLDDDVVPDEGLIAAHLSAQDGQNWRVTIGPLRPPPDARLNAWGMWEARTLGRQYDNIEAGRWRTTYRQFYTGNAAVLKRHVEAVGGFDPAFRRGEDVELAHRLRDHGLHFVFVPEARGWHYVQRSFDAWLRLPVAYSAADVAMARKWPEVLAYIAFQYRVRNGVLRLIMRLCVGRPVTAWLIITLLSVVTRGADAVRARSLGSVACSLIFNLRYYDALSRALGGRAAFQHLMQGGPSA
jgi:GT2 family glycosyltransferase